MAASKPATGAPAAPVAARTLYARTAAGVVKVEEGSELPPEIPEETVAFFDAHGLLTEGK